MLSESEATRTPIGLLRGLWPYVCPYKGRLIGGSIALAVSAGALLAVGRAIQYLVDAGLSKGDVHLLNQAYLFLLGVTLLLAVASYARVYMVAWLGERLVADLRTDIYRRLIQLDIPFFEIHRTGELLSRITTDTTLLQTTFTNSFSFMARNAITTIGGLVLLILTSPALTVYVAGAIVVVLAPIVVLGRRVRARSREAQDKVGIVNAEAEENLHAIHTVQALAIQQHKIGQFEGVVNEAMLSAVRRISLRAFLIALVITLAFGAVVTILWIGGHRVLDGSLSPGTLSSFIYYAVVVAAAVGALSDGVTDLHRAAGAWTRIFEVLSERPTITSPLQPQPLPDIAHGVQLSVSRVSFHYQSRPDRMAVEQISFTVEPGEMVALVGPSGSGKTTLFQLLMRFYDPQEGAILCNGVDIRQFELQDYRRLIGFVPQEPILFSGDVLSNVACGWPGADVGAVRRALEAAAALDFVEALPEGLQTHVGQKGVRLSGGQKQRIAIARALVRNPHILLLDEATSALDSQSERAIQEALSQVVCERTTLVIAHRLSTVMRANRIILLNKGRIEAAGTHTDLLEQSPLYAQLARLQFEVTA